MVRLTVAVDDLLRRLKMSASSLPPLPNQGFWTVHLLLEHIKSVPPPTVALTTSVEESIAARVHWDDASVMLPRGLLRSYQTHILQRIFSSAVSPTRVLPHLIVVPCGAGKTLIGAACIAKARQRALVITNSQNVCKQWVEKMRCDFDIEHLRIACLDGALLTSEGMLPDVALTTYDAITSSTSSASVLRTKQLLLTDFGVILLDEAHKAAAVRALSIIGRLRGPIVGLTATPVREDIEMTRLLPFVAHRTITVPIDALVRARILPRVHCVTVMCDGGDDMLAVATRLVRHFEARNDKLLFFCDDISMLRHAHAHTHTASVCPFGPLTMHDDAAHREQTVKSFEATAAGATLYASRVADEGIDFQTANIGVQLSTLCGSRRQHVQRIGRLQRAKTRACVFFTLVPEKGRERHFATYRDAYLRRCGYRVSVLTGSRLGETMGPR